MNPETASCPESFQDWKPGEMMLLEKFLVQFLFSWKTESTFKNIEYGTSLNSTTQTLALINNKGPTLKWMHVMSIP